MLTQKYLNECIRIHRGVPYWRHRPEHHFRTSESAQVWNKKNAGLPAFNLRHGVAYTALDMKRYRTSSLIWLYHTGHLPPEPPRHLDDNPFNWRFANLGIRTEAGLLVDVVKGPGGLLAKLRRKKNEPITVQGPFKTLQDLLEELRCLPLSTTAI